MSDKTKSDVLDELAETEPIIPIDRHGSTTKEKMYSHEGWKYYLKIKPLLSDWWFEFNGEVKAKASKVKYRKVKDLIRTKVKDKQEREWLYLMTAPYKIWKHESAHKNKKHIVPWVGDWNKRRENGYWVTNNKEYLKHLSTALKDGIESSKAIKATAPFLIRNLMRRVKMQDQIDAEFQGKIFFEDEKIDSKNNIRRFKMYKEMQDAVDESMYNVISWWMRIHGVDPKNPSEMRDMAAMAQMVGQNASAGALTGMVAGMGLHPVNNADGTPSGNSILNMPGNQVPISYDALLLAKHLHDHANTFRKKLPDVEGEIIPPKKEKSNGKHSTQ